MNTGKIKPKESEASPKKPKPPKIHHSAYTYYSTGAFKLSLKHMINFKFIGIEDI